jgi:hypothetical protein
MLLPDVDPQFSYKLEYQGYTLIPLYGNMQGANRWWVAIYQGTQRVGFVCILKGGLFRNMREAMRIVREEYNAPFKCIECWTPISEQRANGKGKCDDCLYAEWEAKCAEKEMSFEEQYAAEINHQEMYHPTWIL